jgi:hypothetical protein
MATLARLSGRCLCGLGLSFFVIFSGGCSSSPAHFKVRGKVVDGDKAVLPDPNSSIHLNFVQIVDEGKPFNSYGTMLNPEDGTFEVVGNEFDGMPAGKYRVQMSSISPNPSATIKLITSRFQSSASPIVVDIVDDKTPLVIDIAPYKKK